MIKIGICDDSQDYIEILFCKLTDCMNDLKIETEIKIFNDLESLKEYLSNESLDILFLDIMFGNQSSVDWSVKNIHQTNMQIIFMTEYPIEAYNISEVEHSYFLIKSRTTNEILQKAVKKAVNTFTSKNPNLIIIKSGSSNYTVNTQDITYLESMNNNVQIHLKNNKSLTVYSTLKNQIRKLPPNFLHCHKSFVVNMNYIKEAKPHEFVLSDGTVVLIPQKKYNETVKKYYKYIDSI
ncbi:MAG: LytTR family DNA-binding domain-containing protein [Clostridiales bacterium]|nr:LytTR family DNA-binding domain-containing protein [Clostridiales bacterium]